MKQLLARAYLEHKGDLGLLLTDDAEIIAHVDEITALLFAAWVSASHADDQRWKERYRWFFEAIAELQDACRASHSMAERGSGNKAQLKRHECWLAACVRLLGGGDADGNWRASVNPRPPDCLGGFKIGSWLRQLIVVCDAPANAFELGDLAQLVTVKDDDLVARQED